MVLVTSFKYQSIRMIIIFQRTAKSQWKIHSAHLKVALQNNNSKRKLVKSMKVKFKTEALKTPLLCQRTLTYRRMFYSSLDSWCSSTSD